jgi:hypothetical protein
MFVWVLILVGWIVFLSLILHDVTKEEAAGSAVLIGARKVRALIASAVIRFRRFRRARARAIARARAKRQAAIAAAAAAAAEAPAVEPAVAKPISAEPAFAELVSAETVSPGIAPSTPTPSEEPLRAEPPQPEATQQVPPEAIKLAPEAIRQVQAAETPTPKRKWWRPHDDRAAKTIPELETAITHAVKSAAPDCRDFVGVIVRQKTPKSRHDVNWELQGIRFGKADKELVNDALRGILKQMQQEYRVPDQ